MPPYAVWWLLLAFSGPAHGQGKQRIELETDNRTSQIVPLGENGLVLFSEAGKGKLRFVKYGSDLEPAWSVESPVNPTLDVVQYTRDSSAVYVLLARSKSADYQVVKLSTNAGFAVRFDLYSINRFEIAEFKANGNDVYLAGRVKNEPVLMHMNLTTKQNRVLPIAYKGTAEIQSVEVDPVTGLVNVAVAARRGKESSMIIKSFAPEGLAVQNVLLPPAEERSLLTGRLSSLSDSRQLVIGTYGLRTSQYTQGLFITKLQDNAPEFTKYYSFTDFKNFFKFMNGRQQERMEKKIQQKKQRGDDLKLQYRLLVHDIIEKDGQYVMVAEAYYPEYRYRNSYNGLYPGYGYGGYGYGRYGGYSPYGSSYGGNAPVFDGYVYTHAVVAGFDQQGNLLWDNSFEFSDIKTYSLREKVKVNVQPGHITLLYSHNGYIKSKVIRGNEVVEGVTNTPIGTEYEGDKVKRSSTDELEYWYGNYFAAWGYQKIRNTSDQPVKSNRNVFYVNKIAF
ncbi:MAG: hypothetical protein H7Z75_14525 [Ferruginibacter sp.]|nr:hypothetical protein [Cytophagales bacterium]